MQNTNASIRNYTLLAGVALSLALQVGILLLGKTGIFQWMGIEHFTRALFYFTRLLFWVVLAVMLWYALRVEKQGLLLWPERRYSASQYIASVMAIFAALIIMLLIVATFLRVLGIRQESAGLRILIPLFRADKFLYVFTCLTAGVVEELIFRGYLLPRLQLLFRNAFLAIVLSSVLFGLLHFGYGTLINMIGPFVISLVFAFYYWRFRNIKVVIFCHFAWDLAAVGLRMIYPQAH